MITRDGIKILDFGLAKLVPRHRRLTPRSWRRHRADPIRCRDGHGGLHVARAGERARVDFRSDQFSLGSILYEMAAGKRAFSRGTAAETLAAIIRDEPEPLESLSPGIPAPLRWVIERCLQKDPHDRYAATRDLARDLARLRDHASEIGRETSVAPHAPLGEEPTDSVVSPRTGPRRHGSRGRPASPPAAGRFACGSIHRPDSARDDVRASDRDVSGLLDLAGRHPPRDRGDLAWPPPPVRTAARVGRSVGAQGSTGRDGALLVGGQSLDGVLRGTAS